MKKLILGLSVLSLVLLVLVFYSAHVFANDRHFNNGFGNNGNNHTNGIYNADSQLRESTCGNKLGDPIINVTQKVQNDVDSGFGTPTYWSFDYYTRHIKVWQTAPAPTDSTAAYCAIVTYDGDFYAVPGQGSPGNIPSGQLINSSTNQPVNGDFSGGYRATFNGTLTPGTWSTNGNVGPTNYQCDLANSCPGYIDWVAQYFGSGYTSFAQPYWGWQYKGGSHGTWVNQCSSSDNPTNPACTGSSGNIF